MTSGRERSGWSRPLSYQAYVLSGEWRALRAKALERDGGRCRLCDSAENLDVHHRRYPRGNRWDLDSLDALTTLCRACHDLTTSTLTARRYERVLSPLPRDVVRLTPRRQRCP